MAYKIQQKSINSIKNRFNNEDDGEFAAIISFLSMDVAKKKILTLNENIFGFQQAQTSTDCAETYHPQPMLLIYTGGENQQIALKVEATQIFLKTSLMSSFFVLLKSFFFHNLKYPQKVKGVMQLMQLVLKFGNMRDVPLTIKQYFSNIQKFSEWQN